MSRVKFNQDKVLAFLGAEFSRAYNSGMVAGRRGERERIIKLLETQAEVTGYVEIELDKLIALIKGENK